MKKHSQFLVLDYNLYYRYYIEKVVQKIMNKEIDYD